MNEPQLTHHIQLDILRRMLAKPELRYSELKMASVEANLFMYHLKQLMRVGLVEKQAAGYTLTRAGKRFADRASLSSMKIRLQPKCITVLAVQRADNMWLLLRRKHQPFLDYKGFPSGKIHYGETLAEAGRRELAEKSGLTGVDLELRGNVVMRFMDGAEPVNHIIGYVFYGTVPATTDIDFRQANFESYFGPEEDFFEPPCFKGHQEILRCLRAGPCPFTEEFTFDSDY